MNILLVNFFINSSNTVVPTVKNTDLNSVHIKFLPNRSDMNYSFNWKPCIEAEFYYDS